MTPAQTQLLIGAQGIDKNGLVAWYKFDEGQGQILNDYSGNGNIGRLGSTSGADTNDPTWSTQGLTFATDDYVNLTNKINIVGKITVGIVAKWDDIPADTIHYAFLNKGYLSDIVPWFLEVSNLSSVPALRFGAFSGTEKSAVLNIASYPAGIYRYIVGVNDGQYWRIFVNGEELGTPFADANGALASTAEVWFGAMPGVPGRNLKGGIMAGHVNNINLTEYQIKQNYEVYKKMAAW